MTIIEKQLQNKITRCQHRRSFGAGMTVAALSTHLSSTHSSTAMSFRSGTHSLPAWMQVVEQRMEQLLRTSTAVPSSENLVRYAG